MQVTYLGHSCFQFEIGGKVIIVDPFIKPNPLAKDIDFASLKADFVLLTHAHWDHTADAIELLQQTGGTLVCQFDLSGWFEKQGITTPILGMNVGGRLALPFGQVRMVQAVHSSSLPDGSYGGIATGYIINTGTRTVYISGDTALFGDMKMFGELYKPDLAFLPMGGHFTMDAQDALLAAQWLGVKEVVGMHFDTFPPIALDPQAAQAAAAEAGIKLHLMAIGQVQQL